MKKKFIAVYALIGVLALGSTTLTSCVDDNESASVTAVRDAKAAQLNALANYKNAQAESEKIVQAAEAAIKEAQAEYLKIQNEMENLKLQEAQATLSIDIETAKAEAEAALIRQQIVLEQAKADLILAAGQADAAVQTKISQLLGAANAIMYGGEYWIGEQYAWDDGSGITYYDKFVIPADQSIAGQGGLQSQLLAKKAEQITVKYNLEDTKRIMADLLVEERTDSAANEALLAAYNEYKTTNKEEALKLAQEAEAALTPLMKIRDDANATYNAEDAKISGLIENVRKTEVGQLQENSWWVDIDGDNANDIWLGGYVEDATPDDIYVNVIYDDGTSEINYKSITYNKYALDSEALTSAIASKDREIKIAEAELDDAKKTRDEDLAADNITYKSYKDAVTTAEKAFNDEPTNANKSALESAIASLEYYENSAEAPVETATETLEDLNAEKKALTDFQTLMTGDAYKTYDASYTEYFEAAKTTEDAWVACLKAEHNYTVQSNLRTALVNYANNLTDWASLISSVTSDLNDNKEKIEKLTAGLYSGNETGANISEAARQDAIDVIAKQIEALETRIAQMQAQYDGYMAEVEALINGETGLPEVPETPAEEETPAEGEETPAE